MNAYGKTIEDVIRNIFIEAFFRREGLEILQAPHIVRVPRDLGKIARSVIIETQKSLNTVVQENKHSLSRESIAIGVLAILEVTGINKVFEEAEQMLRPELAIETFSDFQDQGWETDITKCLVYEGIYTKQWGHWWYKQKNGRKFARELIKLSRTQ